MEMKITVVVNGQPVAVKIDIHEPLHDVVHRVLKESGNLGQPLDRWDLRDDSGQVLSLEKTASALGLKEGETLYLSLRAGEGG